MVTRDATDVFSEWALRNRDEGIFYVSYASETQPRFFSFLSFGQEENEEGLILGEEAAFEVQVKSTGVKTIITAKAVNGSIEDAETLPMACGGVVKLFFEYIGPKEFIYIFGAGHVGQALTNVIKTMNFHVTVVDDRTEVIEKFTGGDTIVNMPFTDYIEQHSLEENSFVIVCTPSHKYDYNVINKVIEKKIKLKYIGMLCSKEKLLDYLDKTYKLHGKDIDLSNFYSPIGLDLGGGSPEEIAISITSEILAISHKKQGHLHMREVINDGDNHYWKN